MATTRDAANDLSQPAEGVCHFLKLAPELRNVIYGLAFTTAVETEEYVYFTAAPPSKAIALSCRQTHDEAAGLYKHAYQRFWRESRFKVPWHLSDRAVMEAVEALRDEDLARVTHVVVEWEGSQMILNDGVWTWTSDPQVHIVVAARDRQIEAEPSKMRDRAARLKSYRCVDVTGIVDPAEMEEAFRIAGRTGLTKYELWLWCSSGAQ